MMGALVSSTHGPELKAPLLSPGIQQQVSGIQIMSSVMTTNHLRATAHRLSSTHSQAQRGYTT